MMAMYSLPIQSKKFCACGEELLRVQLCFKRCSHKAVYGSSGVELKLLGLLRLEQQGTANQCC